MKIDDLLRERITDFAKTKSLSDNPYGVKYTFIGDKEAIRRTNILEDEAWLSGDGDKIKNIYTDNAMFNYMKNPIYNRGNQQMFWARSAFETDFKTVHSGFGHDMIYAMVSKVGEPHISSPDKETARRIRKICEASDYESVFSQFILPQALGCGTSSLKPCFNTLGINIPMVQPYTADNITIISQGRRIVGIVYKDFFEGNDGKDYVLCDFRYRTYCPKFDRRMKDYIPSGLGDIYDNGLVSCVEYMLCELLPDNNASIVPLNTIPDTAMLPKEPTIIRGYDGILGTPFEYWVDVDNVGYGKSVLRPKILIMDDIDMFYSMQSHTALLSCPIEYIHGEYLEKDKDGNPIQPSSYNRKYLVLEPSMANGNGETAQNRAIEDTQPNLNVEQYGGGINALKSEACGSFISPSTLGIGMSKKDNGDAQREKEKTTSETRKHIIEISTKAITADMKQLLMLYDYMETGVFDFNKEYEISVSFDELSTPTTESKVNTFVPMFTKGACTPETMVERVWGNSMSEEQKKHEVDYIYKHGVKEQPDNSKQPSCNIAKDEGNSRPERDELEGIKSDNASYKGRHATHIQ